MLLLVMCTSALLHTQNLVNKKIIIYEGLCYRILNVVFSFKIYFFFFFFCSDFNLEATVVKTDEIRGLKQLLTPCFFLIGKFFFSQNDL